ncbi:hypothetical protein [Zavarzinella formosa]|uniref:hypothetical protein n=1 Tax=Zavarzinella formosa TaxID=360055 RepID=UPI0002EA8A25|nr:hypothetical protein [Zavarzinella formosa]
MRQFIANLWPIKIWMGVVPLSVPLAVCWRTSPLIWLFDDWLNPMMFAGVMVLSWAVGWYGAVIAGWPILAPLYHSQGLANGAPYQIGDYVLILTRKHGGRVARVYAIWKERDQVRVDLGEDAKEKCEDVFSYYEILRESNPPDQDAPPTAAL